MINVGLFESDDQGDIFPKRGSRISVKVGKQYTAEEVLETALKKHSDNDQFFCSLDDYVLCYPDQKIVEFIPGTTERFTVEKYKEEFLSKPYSKMDLFLCNISVYGNCSNMKNSKSNASSNQIEKKVENNIMDNNRHAFIPEISDSLGLHRQKTSFLVVLLLLLVYQILRSLGFLDLLHQLAYQHSRSSY